MSTKVVSMSLVHQQSRPLTIISQFIYYFLVEKVVSRFNQSYSCQQDYSSWPEVVRDPQSLEITDEWCNILDEHNDCDRTLYHFHCSRVHIVSTSRISHCNSRWCWPE